MKYTARVLATVFVLASALSWWSWTQAQFAGSTRSVLVLDYDDGDLAELSFSGPEHRVHLRAREDKLGPYVWAKIEQMRADGSWREAEFQAGARLRRVLKGLSPLKAIRVLHAESPAAFAAFGFAPEQPHFEVTDRQGRSRRLQVGAVAADPMERYIAPAGQSKTLWLVDNYLVASLMAAHEDDAPLNLQELSLVGVRHWHATEIELQRGDAKLQLKQRHIEDLTARHWVRAGSGTSDGEAGEGLAAAAEALCGLEIERYLEDGDWPGDLVLRASFVVVARDGRRVQAELWRDGEDRWYARSTQSRSGVRLKLDPLRRLGESLADLGFPKP